MRLVLGLSVLLLAGALPTAFAVTTTTNVANVAPVVTAASLSGLVGGALNPTAGSTTSASVTISVADDNGYQDIRYVNVTVRKPDGTTHRASSPATLSSGTLLTATYTYSFSMSFHDAPALATDLYKIDVYAKDKAGGATTSLAVATFNFNELAAMSVPSSVSFGTDLTPGASTSATAFAITNTGNVRLDPQVSGTALTHATEAASIAVGKVAWAYASDMSSATPLTGSAVTASSFDLATGASSSKSLHLQLAVPSGNEQWIPEGTYGGTITVGAVKG